MKKCLADDFFIMFMLGGHSGADSEVSWLEFFCGYLPDILDDWGVNMNLEQVGLENFLTGVS